MTDPSRRSLPRRITARHLAARWATLPHLTPDEASAFAEDVTSAMKESPAWFDKYLGPVRP